MLDIDLVRLSVDDLTRRVIDAVTTTYGSRLGASLAVELFDAGSVSFDAHKIADIAQPLLAARESLTAYLWQYENDALAENEGADNDESETEDQNAESVANDGCEALSA